MFDCFDSCHYPMSPDNKRDWKDEKNREIFDSSVLLKYENRRNGGGQE